MSSPADWFNGLPKVTRFYLAGAFISTCAVQLGIVSAELLYLNMTAVFSELEIWRLLTNLLFFGGFGLPLVFNLFFLVRYSTQLEQGRFAGKSADYLVCLALCALVLTVVAGLMGNVPFLSQSLISSIVYLWARLNPTQPLSMFGLFTVQAFYFPWVMVAMSVLMGSSPVPNLLGIFAGHVYHFLVDVQGLQLRAPRFLQEALNDIPRAPEAQYRGNFGGHAWGNAGRRLGD
ncbi:Der1-like family-domain-containing protein [Pavlovales sp. CCMP2436]|nr:Der1-like family-domain-containing protein [Pavlovales sp. CCMP2436]